MRTIRTASGKEFSTRWLSVYDSNTKIQFEIASDDTGTICLVFSNPEETVKLTDIFDNEETDYFGYTKLILINNTDLHRIVVGLSKTI